MRKYRPIVTNRKLYDPDRSPFNFFNIPSNTIMSSNSITPPTELFQGYNSVSGQGLSTLIKGTKVPTGAPPSRIEISVCTSTAEVSKSLKIDQSLSVGKIGVFSAKEKVQYVNDLHISTYSVSVVVYVKHYTSTETSNQYGLPTIFTPFRTHRLPMTIDLSTKEKLKEFSLAYGDSFISSITKGGEFYAVYVFNSRSEEEQKSLKIALEASGLFYGVSVSADFTAELKSFAKQQSTSFNLQMNVSGLKHPTVINADNSDDAIRVANRFLATTLDSPVVLSFTTTGYENVKGIDNKFFNVVAENRNYFIGDPGINNGLVRSLVQLQEVLYQNQIMQDTLSAYALPVDGRLLDEENVLQDDIRKIQDRKNRYVSDPTTSFEGLVLPSLLVEENGGIPTLDYHIDYGPTWGKGKNDEHVNTVVYDVAQPDVKLITHRQRISSIVLVGGAYLDSITLTYASIEENGVSANELRYGGYNGIVRDAFTLPTGKLVTSVSGREGDVIDRLVIQASDGQTIAAGEYGGSEFATWVVPQNAILIGFKGKTSSRYNENWRPSEVQVVGQLQPVYATLLTKWRAVKDPIPRVSPAVSNFRITL